MFFSHLYFRELIVQAPAAAGADADDDDDIDLFADETEDEKKAAEEREAAKKDTKKPKESKYFSNLDWITVPIVNCGKIVCITDIF